MAAFGEVDSKSLLLYLPRVELSFTKANLSFIPVFNLRIEFQLVVVSEHL